MNKLKIKLIAAALVFSGAAKADEGMWLLQMMKEQHSIELMKKAGLQLEENDLYNPNGVSIKDAVGIFGAGCTGEIISSQGLVLTNHHCGYGAIQQHSSVEHDYLTDGFWAKSMEEELPTPGLTFKFIDRIVDVTDIVNEKIAKGEVTEAGSMQYEFLDKLEKELFEASDLKGKPGIETTLLPFYEGNRFFMFYIKVYSDVRMVAAPPSSVGKFGGETDNWMWPRHTGDFSIFRIYADAEGNPAEYDENNVPLNTKKHFTISLQGVEEGDYSMVMGFPGTTERYLTRSEVEMRMKSENEPRIAVREARLAVLREAMAASDKTRIQYASKFASSSNYWKNSIGMNKALVDNKVLESKSEQESNFLLFANETGNDAYKTVVADIDKVINEEASKLTYLWTCGLETYIALEFKTPVSLLDTYLKAKEEKDDKKVEELKGKLLSTYDRIYNKDYDHEVDRKVAKAVLPLYSELVGAERPDFYNEIEGKYKGNYNKFIDELYDNSIFSSKENLEKFIKKPSQKALDKDLGYMYSKSFINKVIELQGQMGAIDDKLAVPHKTYIRGLVEMKQKHHNLPSYPDANFTIRLTYGNVKSYVPRDGVFYDYYTTMEGIMEKEDPTNPEFVVPEKLKELYNAKDFGPYALKDGRMPVAFITTNDITGGNSGSPVIDSKGRLIGCAFDGNWESLSGDIHFDKNLQRCICVDIRYVLFVIDKLGGCKRLIDEMTIEK